MNKKNKGYTLTELLIVVGSMTVIAITVFQLYQTVMNSYRVAEEARRLNRVQQLILDTAGVVGSYENLTTADVIDLSRSGTNRPAALEPQQFDPSNPNRILNVWKFDVRIGPTPNGRGFILTEEGVPPEACSSFVPKLQNTTDQIDVNGIVVKPLSANIDVAAMSIACGSSQFNKIDFHIYKGY